MHVSTNRFCLSLINKSQEEHHKGVSPLPNMHNGLVSHVPVECIHLVCLGMFCCILDEMEMLRQYICCEFQRRSKVLIEVDRSKAVVFQLLVLLWDSSSV